MTVWGLFGHLFGIRDDHPATPAPPVGTFGRLAGEHLRIRWNRLLTIQALLPQGIVHSDTTTSKENFTGIDLFLELRREDGHAVEDLGDADGVAIWADLASIQQMSRSIRLVSSLYAVVQEGPTQK